MLVAVALAVAVVCVIAAGAIGWDAENRAHAAEVRAWDAEATVITQREVIDQLESRVRNLGLRAKVLSVELAGSDDRAKTRVLDTVLPNPVQWSPEPWQVRP